MTVKIFCERLLGQIYGGSVSDDHDITAANVAVYLPDAIGAAAKSNYTESLKLDGVAYVNNSFYSTFKGITIAKDDSEEFLYSLTLPQVPFGLGKNEGVSMLRFTNNGSVSLSAIFLSENEWSYRDTMRQIPNKILCCPEGNKIKIATTLLLNTYKGNVTMVSPGNLSDLDSPISVPDDMMPMITEYVRNQLAWERNQPKDGANDGNDSK